MEEAKALAQHQQQLLQQQQLLLLQQLQHQQQHQQKQQQQSAISRFPSNIDAHLRPIGLNRSLKLSQNPKPNPNSSPVLRHHQTQPPHSNSNVDASHQTQQKQQQQLQEQKTMSSRGATSNQAEIQMAYQDAWRVCHPDFKRPFASLEDACERLLPYHVVADYEAEEDDRILDSDTTGQMPSRSQQWDHNIAAKVAEFTATFEKQALAFNIITRKRAMGEFRSEERLMIEQSLLQEEKRAMLELRAEIELREKAGREAQEAKLRMVAFQAEQARAESLSQAELIARAPIRANALGSQGKDSSVDHEMSEQEQGINTEEMMNGWGNNGQRDEKEPSEDFLNDDETDNGDIGVQEGWHGSGELDLNSR